MQWLIWGAAIVGAVLVGWVIYRVTGVPHEQKFCAGCKQVSAWHPKNGCTVCHSSDSFL